jgi:hypothetical protein
MAMKKHKPDARKNAPTPDQRRARAEMSALSIAWNNLTDDQREAWEADARTSRRGSRVARSRRRSGRSWFFKANFRRLALGQDPLTDPPGSESTCPTPLARLVITNHAGRIVLKVRVAAGQAEGLMVSASRPLNAGVMACRRFTRLGLCPATRAGLGDITREYVAKFGVPPVGKKVFIRIQQMKDYLGSVVYTTSAIVPAEQAWHSEAQGA